MYKRQCLSNLANQHYELRELGGGKHVYDINGELHESCYFLFEGESMHVTIINEEERCGCMPVSYTHLRGLSDLEDENLELVDHAISFLMKKCHQYYKKRVMLFIDE